MFELKSQFESAKVGIISHASRNPNFQTLELAQNGPAPPFLSPAPMCSKRLSKTVLEVDWCNGEWGMWEDFQSDPGPVDLKTEAQKRLDRAKNFASEKGKGKAQMENRKQGSAWTIRCKICLQALVAGITS